MKNLIYNIILYFITIIFFIFIVSVIYKNDETKINIIKIQNNTEKDIKIKIISSNKKDLSNDINNKISDIISVKSKSYVHYNTSNLYFDVDNMSELKNENLDIKVSNDLGLITIENIQE